MLTLEVPEKRESESSRPIFRTDGRNLEGCVRETEISLQTEIAAVRAGETRKAWETREKLGRNEKRPEVDLSTPGVKSFGRQSSYFDASSPYRTLSAKSLCAFFRKMPVWQCFTAFVSGSVGRFSELDDHERFWASVNRRMLARVFFFASKSDRRFGLTARDTVNAGCDFAGFFGCYSTCLINGGRRIQSGIAGFESLLRLIG